MLLFVACNETKPFIDGLNQTADDSYTPYISAYTSGKISSRAALTIQLVAPFQGQMKDPTRLFQFKPTIDGEARWVTSRVIEFQPKVPLKQGVTYSGKFDLGGLIALDEKLKSFAFGFETVAQNFDIEIERIASDADDAMRKQIINGRFFTADYADSAQLVKSASFYQKGSDLKVTWEIDRVNGMAHRFTIQGVERKELPSVLEIRIDGAVLGAEREANSVVPIAALGDFEVLETRVVKTGDSYVQISFSDPLKADQDLNGLITIEGQENIRFDIQGNNVMAYVPAGNSGLKLLNVFPGVRNLLGFKMKNGYEGSVTFEQIKPHVKIVGQGTILPSTDGLIFPFEAVNLLAVDVTVIKIFENNIFQFLQINDLKGNQQLRRVGRPIVQRCIKLDESGVFDLGKWNRFTLNLAEMIQTEPGAIYQVRLNFKKAYSLYDRGTTVEETPMIGAIDRDNWAEFDAGDDGEYDSYYNYDYGNGYNWQERENPCANSYFAGTQRIVSRNVLAS